MPADSAVLLFIATYGIAAHTHDTSNGATQLMVSMLWLFGASLTLNDHSWDAGCGLWFGRFGLEVPFALFVSFILITFKCAVFTHWRDHSLHTAPIVLLIGIAAAADLADEYSAQRRFFPRLARRPAFRPYFQRKHPLFFPQYFGICLASVAISFGLFMALACAVDTPMMIFWHLLLFAPTAHILITGQRFITSLLMFTPGF